MMSVVPRLLTADGFVSLSSSGVSPEVGGAHSLAALHVNLTVDLLASNHTASSWVTIHVDVIEVDSTKKTARACASGSSGGVWLDGLCSVSRPVCVQAMVRVLNYHARRRLFGRPSVGAEHQVKDIRVSRESQRPVSKGKLRGTSKQQSDVSEQLLPLNTHPIAPDFMEMLKGQDLQHSHWLQSRVEWWWRVAEASRKVHRTSDRRRRLLDTFGDSLVFVNQLFNKRFGPESTMRKVPAHMPHFIDREVLAELQAAYPVEFDATSQHRFRSSTDMQYSFAYFYWLQNTKNNQDLPWEALWRDELDVDHSGYLDQNELLTLTSMAKGKEPSSEDLEEMITCLSISAENLSHDPHHEEEGDYHHSLYETISEVVSKWIHHSDDSHESDESQTVFKITLQTVLGCPVAVDGLRKNARKAPTFEKITQLTEVAFEMIGDDFNKTRDQLNSIRARKTKFVCVNDDMKHPTEEMVQFLQDFYLSFFPFPSSFENPPGVLNHFLYYDEWVASRHQTKAFTFTAVVVMCFLSVYLGAKCCPIEQTNSVETKQQPVKKPPSVQSTSGIKDMSLQQATRAGGRKQTKRK